MDNGQWIMIDVILSEAKNLKRCFVALSMTKGND